MATTTSTDKANGVQSRLDSTKELACSIYKFILSASHAIWQYPEAQLFTYIYLAFAAFPLFVAVLCILGATLAIVGFLLAVLVGVEAIVFAITLSILVPILILCFGIAFVVFIGAFFAIKVLHFLADMSVQKQSAARPSEPAKGY
ncbi:hypothetical protein NQZ79_g4696 [Umbelopsis isabellina]|nr:hypothetical protein NQZ79_g4696 [Umbelopsis isabellina]